MDSPREDPLVTTSRREAVATLIIWIVAMSYTIGYYALFALGREPADVRYVLGFPDWIFWGVLVPWGACYLVSLWFSYWFMQDADLGAEQDDPAAGAAEGRDA
jgi:hypothetical protein